jgi:PTS system nitrogen regulatory IIA component
VLKELVQLAEQSWQVYDTDSLLDAVKHREELGTTALESGVAIPHPHRPLSPKAQGESVIAFGRTATGIPFGAPHGALTDLFFLVSCRDAATHLRVLARLSRMMLRPGFLDELRGAETVQDTLQVIELAERELSE